ncbi:cation diffusion facilitator family transporter [uncultured Amnibacterium sp.]|uniref:cation diffusion facilitator family transporter n=1 Tax=uncultured Amnibacterium sp. TaxID=1631851 RepID=UPI0035CBBF95
MTTGHGHGHFHEHEHPHDHGHGVRGFLTQLFVPHTHDAADSIDDALEASGAGVRAVRISLFVLLGTTLLQLIAVGATSSVALLADTIHNFSDALTAVPLWIAFVLARRPATRRYTYGFGRAEDLAGLFIVAVVLLSAIVAGWQSIDRLIHPRTPVNLGWLMVAGVIGFLGNEAVAIYRIRVGRRIGSAALVADGVHARTDGFTSLAVVLGAVGVALGFPLADPIVGILISIAILVLLLGTVRSIGRRLLDGVDPDLVSTADHALHHVEGVLDVRELRLRWIGHRLEGDAEVAIAPMTALAAERLAAEAERSARGHLGQLDRMRIRTVTTAPGDPR